MVTWKNRIYQPYNSDNPKGLILDYIKRIFKGGNDGVSIDSIIRNVKCVKLKRLIMPNDDLSNYFNITDNPDITTPDYTNYYNGFKQDPYLFIHIDGFNSNIISTNNFNKSLFAKPHFDKDYRYRPSLNSCSYISRGWSYFKNDDGDYTEFKPAPLSELTKLSIEILRPDGSLYSDQKDDLLVVKIEMYNTNGTEQCPPFLKITLSNDNDGWVKDNYFNNGDKIIVKKLKWCDDLNLYNPSWKNKISKYLEHGANIVRWNDDTNDYNIQVNRYLKTIIVPNPLVYVNNFGQLVWNTELYGTKPSIDEFGNYDEINIKGFLINYNLQHSLVLEIEVEETKNRIVSEII